MEVTALCMRLVVVLVLQQRCYCAEKADLRIVPNRLQFFEYESISCDCEGFDDFTEWRVMRRIMGVTTICGLNWEKSKGPCVIKNAFGSDSGEYWCEAEGTRRSSSVSISVTAGSVILEIPALPVMEGENVTLRCRDRTPSSVPTADFYKDGLLTLNTAEGQMSIYNVSKSDEGLYKCKISGGDESAESRLTVRVPGSPPAPNREGEEPIVQQMKDNVTNLVQTTAGPKPETEYTSAYREEAPLLDSPFPRVFTPLWMVVTVVPGTLLLLLAGGLYYMKQQTNDECTTTAYYTLSMVTTPTANDESCTTTAYYTLSMGPGEGPSTIPSASTSPRLNRRRNASVMRSQTDN